MKRIVSFAVLVLPLLLAAPANAGQLFGGAPAPGEGGPNQVPSSSDSPQCNRCELDPVEAHGNPPREPERAPPEPAKAPEPEPKGAGGSEAGTIQ